ncbi:MAG TPA: iron-containing alcohol dehydrogenase [Anaerolineae bacterium]
MRFEFFAPTRIIFGPGALKEAGPLAASLGRRPFVVVGSAPEHAAPLLAILAERDRPAVSFPVAGEPTTLVIRDGLEAARQAGCDLIIGFGGGSALDTAKAISAMLTNEGDLLDYLEVVGRGQALTQPAAPCLAVPTTAGTGAEVTRNAVILSPEHRVKVSLRSPLMLPRVAIVDPELTYTLPPAVTASTGLDALTQVIEPYVSHRANPVTDALCREAMTRAARALSRVYRQGNDAAAREDMAIVSLFGGLALANAGLGTVHGFAGVLGGMFPAPHGAICARLLPFTVAANVAALEQRQPDNPALRRYVEVGQILTGDRGAGAAEAIRWLAELAAALGVPPLSAYGLTVADLPDVVAKTAVASSTKANPIVLTESELHSILEEAL